MEIKWERDWYTDYVGIVDGVITFLLTPQWMKPFGCSLKGFEEGNSHKEFFIEYLQNDAEVKQLAQLLVDNNPQAWKEL